jgi:hypothetical protein
MTDTVADATPDAAPAPATTKKQTPKFNHVAMSVPADLLAEEGRREIAEFYREVYGWHEIPQMTQDRKQLVLMAYEIGQFVFLTADKNPMQAARMDHFGMSVSERSEMDEMLERARRWRDKDPRVEIIEPYTDDYGLVKITGAYVRFLLPMMVEIQHFDIDPSIQQ